MQSSGLVCTQAAETVSPLDTPRRLTHARRALPRPGVPSPWWLCSYVQRASAPCTWASVVTAIPDLRAVGSAPLRPRLRAAKLADHG